MGKAMSKTATIAHFAKKFDLKKKVVATMFEELAQLAYKEAKNSFTLPGIGKLVLVNRKARLGRNPKTGETIQIPAKTVVKFRVAKACKEAVLMKKPSAM
ncbi:MAG TPA: HU family DNA-binding protein [Bacteroidota bacterium]|nr:HU family DNA-binding protein [Bacteroidota bacterium]